MSRRRENAGLCSTSDRVSRGKSLHQGMDKPPNPNLITKAQKSISNIEAVVDPCIVWKRHLDLYNQLII